MPDVLFLNFEIYYLQEWTCTNILGDGYVKK